MSNESKDNPFSGLLNSSDSQNQQQQSLNNAMSIESPELILDKKINDLIEKIFLFTINRNLSNDLKSSKQLIFMEEIVPLSKNNFLTLDLLEQALFERLLLTNAKDFLIPNNKFTDETKIVCETKVIIYLFRCFKICNLMKNVSKDLSVPCQRIKSLILRNVSTSIKQPNLYEGQSLSHQWLEILKDSEYDLELRREFLIETAKEVYSDDVITSMGSLKGIFYPMFMEILRILKLANMITLEKWIIPILHLFVSEKNVPQLGELLIDFTTPNPNQPSLMNSTNLAARFNSSDPTNSQGIRYAETLFGQLLCLSILPKNQTGPFEFYDNPTDAMSSLTASLWNYLKIHLDNLHMIFKNLLLMGDPVKSKLLSWIGNCLYANRGRGQIWNTHNLSPFADFTTASDAFMLNLSGVLLRLCQPLFKPGLKVVLVDPTYCAVGEEQRLEKCVHSKKCSEETSLVPKEQDEVRITADTYNFITECFFMTHKALDLGYRVCVEKFARMSREIQRLQNAYQDTMAQGGQDVAQNIMQMLTSQTQQYLCLKNCILEPNNDNLLLKFYEATAIWLTKLNCNEKEFEKMIEINNFAPKDNNNYIKLPLSNYVPPYFKSIPEHLIENIVYFLTFVRNFENQPIETDKDAHCEFFKMILIFMGSIERARNPHLRARLAEGLESLLPKDVSSTIYASSFKSILFAEHEDRLQILPNLLNVFVGIEMTGQSVQFEQKFNYRRPMYRIMDFLWNSQEEQKNCFKYLAKEAERNIEAVDPPIFLRFVNLLMNDAIFLLDDSLNNLQQIRTLQAAQDNGEWNSLPDNERQQNIGNLQHLGNLTKFDNILGRDTINMLKILTSEITDIFCHESLVDRMASMLNYFLLHLVGPKKKNFKVKDKKEYEFDPAKTVLNICQIYINLRNNDNFCLAVSQDGRSWSRELFDFAEQILIRIGGGQLVIDIQEFSTKVVRLEDQFKQDQEALIDPPDEYLDPIMSALMTDPVMLPSSHVTLDRSTIQRHLLSDQTDPFNRSPLTMDQVKPNVQLKKQIDLWIVSKRREYNEKKVGEGSGQ